MMKNASNQWWFNNDTRYQCTWKVIEIGIKQRIRRKKMIKLKIGSWKWKRLMTKLRSRWRAFAHDQYKQSTERVKLGMRKRGEVNENIGKGSWEIAKGKRQFRWTKRWRDGEIVRRWVTWARRKRQTEGQAEMNRTETEHCHKSRSRVTFHCWLRGILTLTEAQMHSDPLSVQSFNYSSEWEHIN